MLFICVQFSHILHHSFEAFHHQKVKVSFRCIFQYLLLFFEKDRYFFCKQTTSQMRLSTFCPPLFVFVHNVQYILIILYFNAFFKFYNLFTSSLNLSPLSYISLNISKLVLAGENRTICPGFAILYAKSILSLNVSHICISNFLF